MKATRIIAILLSVSMICILVFSGCGGTSQTPAAEATQAPASAEPAAEPSEAPAAGTEAAAEPEYTLTFANYNSDSGTIGEAEKAVLARIEEKSNGRIKIDGYWNGTLLEAMDNWGGVSSGMADIGYYFVTLLPGAQTVGEIFTQYFTYDAPDQRASLAAYRDVLEEIPEIEQEANAANLHILDVYACTGSVYGMTSIKDSIKTPADMSGMIVQAQGHYIDALDKIGVSGTELMPTDWYTSLERGVVDAECMSLVCFSQFGIDEICDGYLTFGDNGGLYCGAQVYIINMDTWNSLPADLQEIVTEAFQWGNDQLLEIDIKEDNAVREAEIAAGKKFVHIEQADMQPWYDVAQSAVDEWIADTTAAGYDGQAIWDKYVSIVESYK